jgi:hypothetical protein
MPLRVTVLKFSIDKKVLSEELESGVRAAAQPPPLRGANLKDSGKTRP